MSNETSKCQEMRDARGDFDLYLKGEGIDIGCGPDILKIKEGTVRGWDLGDGDAMLMEGVDCQSYDFVYSSHALEHMVDVKRALRNWVRILKPGGYLYFVVPDYALFEGYQWPSRYNEDHKASFSLFPLFAKHLVTRPNHYLIEGELTRYLERDLNVSPCGAWLEDEGYDHASDQYGWQTLGNALAQICYVGRKS